RSERQTAKAAAMNRTGDLMGPPPRQRLYRRTLLSGTSFQRSSDLYGKPSLVRWRFRVEIGCVRHDDRPAASAFGHEEAGVPGAVGPIRTLPRSGACHRPEIVHRCQFRAEIAN